MKKNIALLVVFAALLLAACNGKTFPAPVPTATTTVDLCASENLKTSVQKVNDLTREFDDASQVAFNMKREQLPDAISNMQRIRREAEDLEAPACLANLKTHQLNYMNITNNTLISFMGGADQQFLTSEIARAKQEHDLYTIEITRLLGITLSPVTNVPTPALPDKTPAPESTATP